MALASLPMYDFPGLQSWTEVWWQGLAAHFRRAGLGAVPTSLERNATSTVWSSDRLFFSQCCGYDWLYGQARGATIVAVPSYRQPYCAARASYRSVMVVHRGSGYRQLSELRGSRCAVNAVGSHSGYNALRYMIAKQGVRGRRFFAAVRTTGSHANSLQAISEDQADVAAIDCVSFALLSDQHPALTMQTRVIARSPQVPGLPYITRANCDDERLDRLRAGLANAFADPKLALVRTRLRLCAVDVIDVRRYRRLAAMRRAAERLGYDTVC